VTTRSEATQAARPLDRNVMRDHDPNHPYVRKLVGCGHGRLFSEPCVDCEVVGLMDEYKRAEARASQGVVAAGGKVYKWGEKV